VVHPSRLVVQRLLFLEPFGQQPDGQADLVGGLAGLGRILEHRLDVGAV
jgi:hypothetical protein